MNFRVPLPIPRAQARRAHADDVGQLLVLQRCCWVTVAIANDTLAVPALHESAQDIASWVRDWQVIVVELDGRLLAAARGRQRGQDWELGRIMVAPDMQGHGLGRWVLAQCEALAPPACRRIYLYTAPGNRRGIEIYERSGYQRAAPDLPGTGHVDNALFMYKTRQREPQR